MASISSDSFANGMSPTVAISPPQGPPTQPRQSKWTYEEAFKRNRGLITEEEQEKLRNCRVAIAGMGGVGGVHLITLARLGIGKFTIADPDVFDIPNFNRQYGATISNLGRNKAEAMAEAALDINPEVELRLFPKAIDKSNSDEFLRGADLFVDGLDFFAIDARRLVFRRAAELGIWTVTAGPIGFSTAWLSFDPTGMTFDEYFDLTDSMGRLDQLAAFAVGLTPKATHLNYTDLSRADLNEGTGPCASIGCQLAAGVIGAAALKILLKRSIVKAAPNFEQFDAYRNHFVKGRLRFANRSPVQRLKRRLLKNHFSATGKNFGPIQSDRIAKSSIGQFPILPPVLRYIPLVIGQTLRRQTLERVPEPFAVTAQTDNVLQYDQVMSTKLAIAYAVGLEVIYRFRLREFGGTAVDLACGPGHMSLLMAKHLKLERLQGVDLSPQMVATATKNACKLRLPQASFQFGDIRQLQGLPTGGFDLTTFCNAAHHINEFDSVCDLLREADRITRPDGLVVVMDLARLKTTKLTEAYVKLVGHDYQERGLKAFYDDFRNSMFAAWTTDELAQAAPSKSMRQWKLWAPAGLPTIQFLLGLPKHQSKYCRRGAPWSSISELLPKSLHADWSLMRRSLLISSQRIILP